jgi:hypothetical protein
MKLRYLTEPTDHAKVQELLDREVPGLVVKMPLGDTWIGIDITLKESQKVHRKRIPMTHPRSL